MSTDYPHVMLDILKADLLRVVPKIILSFPGSVFASMSIVIRDNNFTKFKDCLAILTFKFEGKNERKNHFNNAGQLPTQCCLFYLPSSSTKGGIMSDLEIKPNSKS